MVEILPHNKFDLPNAVDKDGNVVPIHDVIPGYGLGDQVEYADTQPEEPPEQQVGSQAVKQLVPEPVVDQYPDLSNPPEYFRLAFGKLTGELFETMKNEDKRFVALSIWRANKQGRAHYLTEGMSKIASTWLRYEDPGPIYTPWNDKYRKIVKKHQKAGDGEPWIEFYQGTFKGQKTNKARVVWDKNYSLTRKNQYYSEGKDGEIEPPLRHEEPVSAPPTIRIDRLLEWERQQEEKEEELRRLHNKNLSE